MAAGPSQVNTSDTMWALLFKSIAVISIVLGGLGTLVTLLEWRLQSPAGTVRYVWYEMTEGYWSELLFKSPYFLDSLLSLISLSLLGGGIACFRRPALGRRWTIASAIGFLVYATLVFVVRVVHLTQPPFRHGEEMLVDALTVTQNLLWDAVFPIGALYFMLRREMTYLIEGSRAGGFEVQPAADADERSRQGSNL